MATAATFHSARPGLHADRSAWEQSLALFVYAGLPLGLFGLLHLGAEALGLMPLFFTPFGLPTWTGAAAHLAQLALVGAAYWAVTQANVTGRARPWLIALAAAYLVLPFATPMLDSLMLALVCTLLLLLVVATTIRAGSESLLAGWMLAPMLAMVGLSAAMGLAVAAYAPPFALTQTQQAPPTA